MKFGALCPPLHILLRGHGDMWRGSMSTEHDEFYQSLDADNITPEQAAQMLEMGWKGDTDTAESETGSETPAASTESDAGESDDDTATDEQHEQDKGEGQDQAKPDAEQEPVLLAKDGKHTIPYDKLVEAREGEKHWKQQAEANAAELERLKAEAQERADAGEAATQTDKNAAMAQDAIDNGVDPDLFGDFTEEDLAKGVAKLVQMELAERDKRQQQQQQEQQQQTAAEAHYNAIYEAHPDADSIAESKELGDWLKAQPTHVRKGCEVVLSQGSTEEVIELFDTFKRETGVTQAKDEADAKGGDAKAKARAAIESTESEPPGSLSDIPGGAAGAATPEEQMASLSEGKDLLERMEDMSPEKIEAFLNKQL